MVHIPGPENVVADTLSRPSTNSSPISTPALVSYTSASALVSPTMVHDSGLNPLKDILPRLTGFDISLLPPLQVSCPSVQEMKVSPSLSMVSVPLGAESLLCDSSTGSLRPLVPLQLRRQLFNLLHDVSHPGVHASLRLVSTKFVWPGLSRDVGLWAKSCLRCQRSKISTHVHSSVPAIPVPTRRFSHVHIDIVGPLPSSQGFNYLLTMIDRTTWWPEVAPLSSISAESCA